MSDWKYIKLKKIKAEKPLGIISAMWNFRKFSLWIYSVEDF